jgi:predicted transcriptional regulator
MAKPKEAVRQMLDEIPEDATFEDIQYHLYVLAKIERGLADIEEGRVLTAEEVDVRLSRWLGE